jgi:proline dehydrogenase
MLQSTLLHLSRLSWAQHTITRLPVAHQMARRFVCGESIDAAIDAVSTLNGKGLYATLDFLGESVTDQQAARNAGDEYLRALDALAAAGARSNISLKLTQLGLDLGEEFCLRNVRRVVAHAKALDNFVRVDMESTAYTDRTLAIVRALHAEFGNVGAVLQAYLYRTEADLLALADAGISIRLCKGAYREPADKAFPRKADVDANYAKLARMLLERCSRAHQARDGRIPPLAALATHDEKLIADAQAYAAERQLPRDLFEFQILYGVRRDLQAQLVSDGFAVRVYVPYGTHWYPYFMRRLAERPANLWFFVKSALRR